MHKSLFLFGLLWPETEFEVPNFKLIKQIKHISDNNKAGTNAQNVLDHTHEAKYVNVDKEVRISRMVEWAFVENFRRHENHDKVN